MRESALRDLIAGNINILEQGLVLLEKEQYLPNNLGTRSFIDLYAHDQQGNHVLIELKISEASSREAIHEVYKYVEGVKKHFGVRDKEIRVIIASTEWRELFVPFSRFVADTFLNVTGLKITLNEKDEIVKVSKIEPLSIYKGRFIAPWHEVYWYFDESNLNLGIDSINTWCDKNHIEDYVLLVISFKEPICSETQIKRISALKEMAKINKISFNDDLQYPEYRYLAYFAMQVLSVEGYLQILKRSEELYADIVEDIKGMDDEEKIYHLHESVSDLEPSPKSDYLEIGYPAKLNDFLEKHELLSTEIKRYGIFKRNSLLEDETIISELLAKDGTTGQQLKTVVELSDRSQLISLKTNIQTCLEDNLAWKNQILRILNDIEQEFPSRSIDVSIFNPGTGLFTILFVTSKENGEQYIPIYSIIVKDDTEPLRMYFGGIQDCGCKPLTFRQLLNKYYEGDLSTLLFSLTWGGRDNRDSDIIEDLGGAYRSFFCDIQKDDNHIFYELNNDRWQKIDSVDPFLLFNQFLQKNEQNLKEMHMKILPQLKDGVFYSLNVKMLMDKIADIGKGERFGKYNLNAPWHCSSCGCSFEEEQYMIDGIKDIGCLCQDCYVNLGEDVNNAGGLYLRQGDRWLLVGGRNMVELENKILRQVRKEEEKRKKKKKAKVSKESRRKNRN